MLSFSFFPKKKVFFPTNQQDFKNVYQKEISRIRGAKKLEILTREHFYSAHIVSLLYHIFGSNKVSNCSAHLAFDCFFSFIWRRKIKYTLEWFEEKKVSAWLKEKRRFAWSNLAFSFGLFNSAFAFERKTKCQLHSLYKHQHRRMHKYKVYFKIFTKNDIAFQVESLLSLKYTKRKWNTQMCFPLIQSGTGTHQSLLNQSEHT